MWSCRSCDFARIAHCAHPEHCGEMMNSDPGSLDNPAFYHLSDPSDDDRDACTEDGPEPGEECGRWRNGTLAPVGQCLAAGTEDCQFCPYNH